SAYACLPLATHTLSRPQNDSPATAAATAASFLPTIHQELDPQLQTFAIEQGCPCTLHMVRCTAPANECKKDFLRAVKSGPSSGARWCSRRQNARGLCPTPDFRAEPIELPSQRSVRPAAQSHRVEDRGGFPPGRREST